MNRKNQNTKVPRLLSRLFLTLLFSLPAIVAAQTTEVTAGNLQAAFSSWGKPALQGDWKIVSEDDRLFIELADNFKAKEGPDVKIFLSPLSADQITGKNATEGSVFIHQIDVFENSSRIEISDNVNLDNYQTLVFHCEEYSKLWGVSAL